MKKRRIALAVLSCALLTGSLVACNESEEPIYVKNEIVSISIKTPPTKTTYKVGEVFDPTGVVIESTWKDGQKKIVSGYTWDKHDPLTLQDKVITFTYQNFTCTLDITVREVAVKGIIIKEQPYKLEYKINQKFDPTGLVVHAVYEDESTLEVKDYTIVDADRELKESDKEMIVRYKTFEAKISITVTDPVDVVIDDLKTIRLEAEELDFSEAILREDFAQAGRGFIESPNDGSVTSGGKSICGYNLNSIFKIRFEAKEDSTILIKAAMADIGKDYSLSEALEFKMDDQVIVAQDKEFGKNGYWDWCEFPVGVVSISKGKHTFSVKCVSGKPNMDYFDFVVTKYGDKVMEKELVGYEVKSAPTKTHYVAGETVDLSGLVLTAKYNDDSTEDITEGFTAKKEVVEITDTEIVAIYDGHEFAFPITVEGHVDYVIDDVKEITIEAEDLPFEGIEEKQSDKDWSKLVEANSYASGGKSLHSVVKASWSWDLDVQKELNLEVVAVVCKYEAIQTGTKYEIKLDGVHFDNDNITLGRTDGNDWYNFKDSKTEVGKVAVGSHKISFNILDAINVDKIVLKFTDPNAEPEEPPVVEDHTVELSETETVRFEAERVDTKDWVIGSGNDTPIVERADASGGKFLAAATGNVTNAKPAYFKIVVPATGKYDISGAFAQVEGKKDKTVDMSLTYKLVLDDTQEIALTGNLDAREDITQWQTLHFEQATLTEGTHDAKIVVVSNTGSGTANIDYFDFAPVEEPEDTVDYVVDEAKEITIEAEDLPIEGIEEKQSDKDWEKLVEPNSYASGGKSLHSVFKASWSWTFDLKEEFDLEAIATVCKYEAIQTGEAYDIKVDGVHFDNDNITLGRTDGNDWYNFKDSKTNIGKLSAGVHTISFNILSAVNVDKVLFKFSEPAPEPDYVIDEAKEITLEAEDLPIEGIEEKQSDKDWEKLVEPNSYASGGKSLHSVLKASWSWTFDLKEEFDLEAIATVCKYEAIQTGGAYDIKIDGEHVDNDNITLGRTDGNDWYNFKDSKTNVSKLSAGIHTISFNILSAVNVDKISFKFTEPSEEPIVEEADYTVSEAQNIRIEGENLPQSGIKKIQAGKDMNQLVEPNSYSSNSASLHAVEEAEWSYIFDLEQELSLEVLARVGKYEDVVTGDRYSVVVDGVEIENDNITLGHTDDNPWYTFKDSKSSAGKLSEGRHVIKFVIKQNINVDYIEFQFSAAE
ncbi:MAG: bacterial Ig-like domain-containing protein [Bacilli bacterium]|nr:bacterial Ig-like domain-containing protein [Bacilli bacterium]